MSLAVLVALCTIVGVPLAVVGIVLVVKQQAREQAAARAAEKQATYNDGVIAGKALMQPTVDLITSQRDDARHDRDDAQRRADTFEARYNDLRDRGVH